MQRDGLKARVTQLERDLEEHKDNNAKLQRQLDNLQGLKKSDDADLEILRKNKVELEIQARETKADVEQLEKVVEKERGRVSKLKDVLREWKVRSSFKFRLVCSTDPIFVDRSRRAADASETG